MQTLPPFELKAWCALSWQRGPVQLATELLQFQFWGASPNFWDSILGATTFEAMTLKLRGRPWGAGLLLFPSLVHNPYPIRLVDSGLLEIGKILLDNLFYSRNSVF
jgi:hypothetical protein